LQSLRSTAAQQAPVIHAEILKDFSKGTEVSSPAGGFLFCISCVGINIEKFCAMASTVGISVAPGTIFSSAGELQNAMRLSFGMNMSPQVLRAIAQLGSIATRCQRELVFSTPP
jgi:DNA-binding transcriptional MocR family regulator